ncbi:MAG: sel1 repeat family protein [Lentisphaeraceae bacterium]|nr:sel1 repeat family protein [Lentisphaeraceae bacterium]
MKVFALLLCFMSSTVFGQILPEVEWELPSDWQTVSIDNPQAPFVIVPSKGTKILVMRFLEKPDTLWSIVKSWRTNSGLPILTEDELDSELKNLKNGVKIISFTKDKKEVFGGFYSLHGNLWTFKLATSAQDMFLLKSAFEDFLGSVREGQAIQKYTKKIQEKSASKEIDGQLEYADLLVKGRGVKKDIGKAVAILQDAKKAGSLEANFKLAIIALDQGQLNRCFKLLQEGATRKHIGSLKKLAGLLLEFKNDYSAAVKYLKTAAELGDSGAMHYLGNIYARDNEHRNADKAFKWINMAASKGYSSSLYVLGTFYRQGFGVQVNYAKAATLFEKAAEKNDKRALETLGDMHRLAELGEPNFEKALAHYVKSTMDGSSTALVKIAEMYFGGKGVKKNIPEGLKLLEEAARRSETLAMNRLGDLFTRGLLVPADFDKAYKWYLASAEEGDANGMFGVSLALFSGNGVEKNHLEAVKWMQMAAAKGHVLAEKMLKDTGFK